MIFINSTSTQYISEKANMLIKKYKTSNPIELCDKIGIHIRYRDIGSLKGMYQYYKRNRFIIIHSGLNDTLKKAVCAHELGHDLLHRKLCSSVVRVDVGLLDLSLQPEFEANVFAAELLINDNEFVHYLNESVTAQKMGVLLNVPEALVKVKAAVLENRGVHLKLHTAFDYNIFK